jgi:hypothetical protein
MTEQDNLKLSVAIREAWPATNDAEGEQALAGLQSFTIDVAMQAVAELRAAMPDHHRRVESNRLAAVCRQIADKRTQTPRSRIAEATEYSRQLRERTEQMQNVRAEDFARIDAEFEAKRQLAEQAEEWCVEKYSPAWAAFSESRKSQLVKIRVSQMTQRAA